MVVSPEGWHNNALASTVVSKSRLAGWSFLNNELIKKKQNKKKTPAFMVYEEWLNSWLDKKQKGEPEPSENKTNVFHWCLQCFLFSWDSFFHLSMNPTVTQQGVHPLLPGLGYRTFTACHLRLRTCQPAFWNAAPTRWGSHSPDLRCLTSSERRGCLSQSHPLHSQTPAGSHREAQLGRCQLPSGSKRGANITYCHFMNLYVQSHRRKHWERERVMQQVLKQKPCQIHKVQSLC